MEIVLDFQSHILLELNSFVVIFKGNMALGKISIFAIEVASSDPQSCLKSVKACRAAPIIDLLNISRGDGVWQVSF